MDKKSGKQQYNVRFDLGLNQADQSDDIKTPDKGMNISDEKDLESSGEKQGSSAKKRPKFRTIEKNSRKKKGKKS